MAPCTAQNQNMFQNASMKDLFQPCKRDERNPFVLPPLEEDHPPPMPPRFVESESLVKISSPCFKSAFSRKLTVRDVLNARIASRSQNAAEIIAFLTSDSSAEQERQLAAFRKGKA
jgi:hypothetical protein